MLNAAAALLVSGHVNNLGEGVDLARETHLSGKALRTLNLWKDISNVRVILVRASFMVLETKKLLISNLHFYLCGKA